MHRFIPKLAKLFVLTAFLYAGLTQAQQVPPSVPIEPLQPVPEPAENPITEEKRILGKILFWEEQLSSDNTVACGTCHMPASGGSDNRLSRNPGIDGLFNTDDDIIGSSGIRSLDASGLPVEDFLFGHSAQVTGRNSQSFLTAMYADSNFWDGRATDSFVDPLDTNNVLIQSGGALESQAVGPILSSVEMAKQSRTWTEVTEKLSSVEPLFFASNIPPDMASALSINSSYPELFDAAFASAEITPARIAMAIASYERTLFPDQTPWDLYMAGDLNAMTANQIEGWELFSEQTVCDNCHVPPLFTDNLSYNIGLRPALEDFGLQEVSGESEDFGRFKTPSLRNVGLRRALMHVGWITDVQDSVDFYNAESNETQHTQFTENQTDIPTGDSGIVREYSELSFFGPSASMQAIVVDFMVNALTDPRVAAETFPFDRPTLRSELAPSPLKVMSFNIQAPGWNASRAETVSAVILDEAADVIGLQEALALQKSDLTELLGENYDFLSFQSDNSHPILLRKGVFNVIASGSMDEPIFCVIERYINYVVLQQISTGHQFIVHNSQFCPMVASFPAGELTAQQRNQNHVSVLAQTMEANLLKYALPMIVLGDLNANSTSTSMQFLLQGGLLSDGLSTTLQLDDSWSIANPAVEKDAPIDWILATEDITVQKAAVVNSELAKQASDHLPVTATLIIEGEKSKGNIVGSTSGSLPTNSSFRGSVSDSSGNSDRSTFSSASVLSISATIYADPAEIGSSADVYTLVLYEGTYYMKDENGEFSIWDGTLDSLLSSSTIAVLSEIENLSVVSGLSGITGEFQIFVAYSIEDNIFQYNQSAVEFVVE